MSTSLRPIDIWMLVIEVAVFLLIAYEVGSGVWAKMKSHRRLKAIFARMAEGQQSSGTRRREGLQMRRFVSRGSNL